MHSQQLGQTNTWFNPALRKGPNYKGPAQVSQLSMLGGTKAIWKGSIPGPRVLTALPLWKGPRLQSENISQEAEPQVQKKSGELRMQGPAVSRKHMSQSTPGEAQHAGQGRGWV